jgi:hypothetical protein
LFFKFVVQGFETVGPYFVALETLPPSFVLSLLVGYLVTIWSPDPVLEKQYVQDLSDLESTDTELDILTAASVRDV